MTAKQLADGKELVYVLEQGENTGRHSIRNTTPCTDRILVQARHTDAMVRVRVARTYSTEARLAHKAYVRRGSRMVHLGY